MSREEAQEVGISIATDMARKIKEVADGLYMMTPFNRFEMVSKIIQNVKKRREGLMKKNDKTGI